MNHLPSKSPVVRITCHHLLVALGQLHPEVPVGRADELQQLGSIRVELQQAPDGSDVAGAVGRVDGDEGRVGRRRGGVGGGGVRLLLFWLLCRQRTALASRGCLFSEQKASKSTQTSVSDVG